ncbi:MAG: hypothetical protein ACJAU3_000775 [Zhongshania sp.]|jgi:hypothetical protein
MRQYHHAAPAHTATIQNGNTATKGNIAKSWANKSQITAWRFSAAFIA